jgi:hypothetical protein
VDEEAEPEADAELADEETAEGEPAGEATDEEATEAEQPRSARQASSKQFVAPRSRVAGLPSWFLAKDANGDGQLTVAEYAPDSEKSRLADFARSDRNQDGVLTAQECPK